jgi:hypothetical protein
MQNIRKVSGAMYSLGDSVEQSLGRYVALMQGFTFHFPLHKTLSVDECKGTGITVEM